MVALVASVLFSQTAPNLAEIYAKIAKFPGVTISAEMISPSVIPITWKISPTGKMVATYPTSVQYNTSDKWTVWMPDRREYSISKPERSSSPLPSGFESIWPNANPPQPTGDATEIEFEKRSCYAYPLKASMGFDYSLFVDKATLLPYGTRAKFNGNTYETVYRVVKIGAIPVKELEFVPPPDARIPQPGERRPELISPGSKLTAFKGMDQFGKSHSLQSLVKGKRGAVLNFWFSSCTGCIAEMPYLTKIHPDLQKSQIALLGVNSIDNKSITTRTSDKNKLPFPTLGGKAATDLTKQVSITAYPVTLIIDKEQKVVDAILGFDEQRLQKAITKLKAIPME